jgi:hypothetical protein
MRKVLWILVLLLVASSAANVFLLTRQPEVEVIRDTKEVVRWDTVHDTLPPVKGEKTISHVTIPCKKDAVSAEKSNAQDDSVYDGGVTLPIVQRTYSDDSTYTAYVSGVKLDSYPRLDSINILQKNIERTITNTIYKEKHGLRLKIRPAVNVGYDLTHGTWGVMAGGAVIMDW